MHRGVLLLATVCLVALGFSGTALADAIDGDWCHSDGKRMSISGPAIVTPGGRQMNGDYARHSFSYVIPSASFDLPSAAIAEVSTSCASMGCGADIMRHIM
jgi:hypothetical protein